MASDSNKVLELKDALSKAISSKSESELIDILKVCSTVTMNIALLRNSRIGSCIQEIKKNYVGKSVYIEAKNVASKWRKDCITPALESVPVPTRVSSRAKKAPVSYKEPNESDIPTRNSLSKEAASSSGATVNSNIGHGNIEIYPERQPLPKRNAKGELVFPDYPLFRPNLTPKEVLQLGSFGGTYFRPITSGVTGIRYQAKDVVSEYPKDWFEGLNMSRQVCSTVYDKGVNRFNAECGGDLYMWESSGWIKDSDPYGWFQWYCRFYLGRRCEDDERQISRGLGVMGPRGRWRNNLLNKLAASNKSPEAVIADHNISPKVRQLLQHWGLQLNAQDVIARRKEMK